MTQLNWLDPAIVFFAFLSCCAGIRAGLIRSGFNVAGVISGLIVAARYYSHGGNLLTSHSGMPPGWADLISLILIFLIVSFIITSLGILAANLTRFRPVKVADRIGGAAAGIGIGVMIIGALLIVLTTFPLYGGIHEHLESSLLAPQLIETSSALYEKIEARLPFQIPKLAFHPEELAGFNQLNAPPADFKLIDFSALDGATCFVCGEEVSFLGYQRNRYGTISPKFICTGCGRTSDGCQTYEGHHLLYDRCPVDLGRQGYRFDCGIWSNGNYHRPTGRCPVCGAGG
jgi:uncharacterized membrane protein required for colicin V production